MSPSFAFQPRMMEQKAFVKRFKLILNFSISMRKIPFHTQYPILGILLQRNKEDFSYLNAHQEMWLPNHMVILFLKIFLQFCFSLLTHQFASSPHLLFFRLLFLVCFLSPLNISSKCRQRVRNRANQRFSDKGNCCIQNWQKRLKMKF